MYGSWDFTKVTWLCTLGTYLDKPWEWVKFVVQMNTSVGHITHVKSISTGAQYVTPDSKFIAKMSKCASLAQENDFSAPNSFSLLWLVKGATQLCTFKKVCNKLDLTAAQYFWLVDHNNWSMWFAINSSHVYTLLVTVLLVGLPKKKEAKLRHLILLSRVTYWSPVEMI